MIGLFGGTFDPVHVGHELMVSVSLKLGLDRVVVTPCFLSPHKTDPAANERPASGEDRVRMLELALDGLHGVEISRFELDKGGVSFTWQTLEFLRQQHPHDRVALIVGSDQYQAFSRWERFAEWSRGLDIFVFKREGVVLPKAKSESGPVYHWPEDEIPEVSASEIRNRVRAGKSLQGLVSARVEEYIRIKRLYLSV